MEILSIIMSIIAVIGCGLSYYFYIKTKITNAATDVVNAAEDSDLVKEEKMLFAINEIKKLIPVTIKPFITDAMLQVIIQHAFDNIEIYANKKVTEVTSKKAVKKK